REQSSGGCGSGFMNLESEYRSFGLPASSYLTYRRYILYSDLQHSSDKVAEGSRVVNLGLLLVRLAFGTLMAAHGAQKLFGWFGGYGLNGTGQFFAGLGFRPGRTFAFAAGASEAAGGLLVAFGFLHPLGAALIVSVMLVAT